MTQPKTVAGLHCVEVLEVLDDYVAGTLSPEVRRRLEAHLGACDACLAFGGRYTALVQTLHVRFAPPTASATSEERARALFRRARDSNDG